MLRIIAFIILFSLTSCAVIGSKEILTVGDDSDWKTMKFMSKETYHLKCEKMSIDINEVVIKSKTTAYGPILPIIPSGRIIDRSVQNLELNLQLVGEVNPGVYHNDTFDIKVISSSNEIYPVTSKVSKISEEINYKGEGVNWIHYHIHYGFFEKLEELNELSIQLSLPFSNCEPKELHLERRKVSDNEFIWSLGA